MLLCSGWVFKLKAYEKRDQKITQRFQRRISMRKEGRKKMRDHSWDTRERKHN